MSGRFRKRIWRTAVGLIAVYAFVLQSVLALSVVSQAAAQDVGGSDPFSIICASHDQGLPADGAAGGDLPAKPNTHCQLCTLAAVTAATVPDPVSLPGFDGVRGTGLFVSTAACLSFHRARVGLSRAPPQNV
jgi:hypothetical protein